MGAEVVVLATEQLFTHTGSNLGLEVENGAEAEVTTLAALVILAVLDPSASTERIHTCVDIFVQMQSLLCLRHPSSSCHEQSVQEIRVTVVQLGAQPRPSTSREGTEGLLLASRDVSQDTNVLREDVLASTDNGDG